MIFQERQTLEGFEYKVEDLFGVITISSVTDRLDAPMLDTIVMHVLKSGMISGSVSQTITFEFAKAPAWVPDEEKPAAAATVTAPEKSRTVLFLLAFFLGCFGAHRFYAGKPGSAIAMLLLTLTFFGAIISGIWALCDCFVIAVLGTFSDSEGRAITKW